MATQLDKKNRSQFSVSYEEKISQESSSQENPVEAYSIRPEKNFPEKKISEEMCEEEDQPCSREYIEQAMYQQKQETDNHSDSLQKSLVSPDEKPPFVVNIDPISLSSASPSNEKQRLDTALKEKREFEFVHLGRGIMCKSSSSQQKYLAQAMEKALLKEGENFFSSSLILTSLSSRSAQTTFYSDFEAMKNWY